MTNPEIETPFGQFEFPLEAYWRAHACLPGFKDERDFVLLDVQRYRPLIWLQSTRSADVCFALANPAHFSLRYPPPPLEKLFNSTPEQYSLMVLVIFERQTNGEISATPHQQGPLCFNTEAKSFVQWIIDNPKAIRTADAKDLTPPETRFEALAVQ